MFVIGGQALYVHVRNEDKHMRTRVNKTLDTWIDCRTLVWYSENKYVYFTPVRQYYNIYCALLLTQVSVKLNI